MGEEKQPETERKAEDQNPKAEDGKPMAAEDEKPKKEGGGSGEEKKQEEAPAAETAPPPPPSPEEMEMRVFMHCEGCARKVRRSLKGFAGVEEVRTDCRAHKVVVKGKKAAEDPLKVVERVQKKTGRKVELLSPLPPPKAQQKEVEEKPKVQDKKDEPVVMTVVLKVHMHCEACAQEIKERILRMKGVQSVESDLKASQVVVKGVLDPTKLVEHVYKRIGKHAVVVKAEPVEKKAEPIEKKEEEKETDEKKDGNKAEECDKGKEEEKGKDEKKDENKTEGDKSSKEAGDEKEKEKEKEKKELSPEQSVVAEALAAAATVATTAKIDQKRNEFYYYYPTIPKYPMEHVAYDPYPQHHQHVTYTPQPQMAYAPQIFSDENPNACSVM